MKDHLAVQTYLISALKAIIASYQAVICVRRIHRSLCYRLTSGEGYGQQHLHRLDDALYFQHGIEDEILLASIELIKYDLLCQLSQLLLLRL